MILLFLLAYTYSSLYSSVSSDPLFVVISFAVLNTDFAVSFVWIDTQKSTKINGAQRLTQFFTLEP